MYVSPRRDVVVQAVFWQFRKTGRDGRAGRIGGVDCLAAQNRQSTATGLFRVVKWVIPTFKFGNLGQEGSMKDVVEVVEVVEVVVVEEM